MKKHLFIIVALMAGLICNAQSGTLSFETSAKTETANAEIKVKVFPNPATNVVNILGLKNTSKADITVLDIYGNIVLAHQWPVRRNALNIPIAQLEPGAYIVRIQSDENQVQTKFYKQQ